MARQVNIAPSRLDPKKTHCSAVHLEAEIGIGTLRWSRPPKRRRLSSFSPGSGAPQVDSCTPAPVNTGAGVAAGESNISGE